MPKCLLQMSENGSRDMKLIDSVALGSAHHHHVHPPSTPTPLECCVLLKNGSWTT